MACRGRDGDRRAVREAGEGDAVEGDRRLEGLDDRGDVVVLVQIEAVHPAAVTMASRVEHGHAIAEGVEPGGETGHRRMPAEAPETGYDEDERTRGMLVEIVGDGCSVERLRHPLQGLDGLAHGPECA